MGFDCTDTLEINNNGLEVVNMHFSFLCHARLQKNAMNGSNGVYKVFGDCYVYSSVQAKLDGKTPISNFPVEVEQAEYPTDCMLILYTACKADARFVGKTLVDN